MDVGGRITWWCFPRFDSGTVLPASWPATRKKFLATSCLEGAVASENALLTPQHGNRADHHPRCRGQTPANKGFHAPFTSFERVFQIAPTLRRIELRRVCRASRSGLGRNSNYADPMPSRASGSKHIRTQVVPIAARHGPDDALSYIAHADDVALIKPGALILGPD